MMIIDENDHEYLAKQRYEQRKIKLSKSSNLVFTKINLKNPNNNLSYR